MMPATDDDTAPEPPPWLQPPVPPPPGRSVVRFGPDEGTDWGPLAPDE